MRAVVVPGGGVLILKRVATIPAISTQQQLGKDSHKPADIPPNLMGLCAGDEHFDDVVADIDQALVVAQNDYFRGGARDGTPACHRRARPEPGSPLSICLRARTSNSSPAGGLT